LVDYSCRNRARQCYNKYMATYLDKRTNGYFVQFDFDNKTYKKRFSKDISKDDVENYEAAWKRNLTNDQFGKIGASLIKDENLEVTEWVIRFNELVNEKQINKKQDGFVYVIRFLDFYKIGYTTNPTRRLSDFTKVSLPSSPELIESIQTKYAMFLETILHKKFADQRLNGEWFILTPIDLDFLSKLAKALT
jgi:hypothetical protein